MKSHQLFILFMVSLPLFTTAQSSLAKNQSCPCCTEMYRAFDFWLGEWIVYKPDGSVAGENKIVTLQDSCILQENWISATPGYRGTSYNWYDSASRKWHQTWIDNQGGSLQLSGGRKGNQMVLESDPAPDGKGGMLTNRITWTKNPDGTVRQLWEVTRDYGKNWSVLFDGHYKRKK